MAIGSACPALTAEDQMVNWPIVRMAMWLTICINAHVVGNGCRHFPPLMRAGRLYNHTFVDKLEIARGKAPPHTFRHRGRLHPPDTLLFFVF